MVHCDFVPMGTRNTIAVATALAEDLRIWIVQLDGHRSIAKVQHSHLVWHCKREGFTTYISNRKPVKIKDAFGSVEYGRLKGPSAFLASLLIRQYYHVLSLSLYLIFYQ